MDLNTVINGLLVGGIYALVALGLSLVFGVLRMINIAHGELMVAGAYLSYKLSDWLGVGPFLSLPVVIVVVGAIAYALQRYLLTGLLVRGAEGALVATFGLSLLAQGLFARFFTSQPRSLDSPVSTAGFGVFGVHIRTIYLIAFCTAGVLCLIAHLALTRTRAGTRIRAAAADPSTAGLMGIDIRRVYAITFALSAIVAAIGGVFIGITFSFTPTTGMPYLLIGIAVVVLGGIGNVLGTFVGAICLGVVQSVAAAELGGGYRDLTVYLLFFVVLVVRPQGLFAKKVAA